MFQNFLQYNTCIDFSSYLKLLKAYDMNDVQPFLQVIFNSPNSSHEYLSKNEINQTGQAVRHGGGVVKLLLKCLQSIQCQYYLVFGVVTVPLFRNL